MMPIDREPKMGSVQSLLFPARSMMTLTMCRISPIPLNISNVCRHCLINVTLTVSEKNITLKQILGLRVPVGSCTFWLYKSVKIHHWISHCRD